MKVLALSGGQRNGSNDSMAKEALMGAKESGAEIEFIRLLDLDLKPCTGCVSCVNSLMTGGNGDCHIKDDFNWLAEKMLNADAIIFANPVFEKSVPAVFKIVQDRFCGPANDTGIIFVAKKIATKMGKPGPDPRKFETKVVSYISIGGSDWTTRVSCDMNVAAMSGMWRVIDDEVFTFAKLIICEDEKVAKCHQIGVNIVKATEDIENAKYIGPAGVCPNCNSRNFYIHTDAVAECIVCGIKGKLTCADGEASFVYPEEQMEHAHNYLPGKIKHMDDIHENETKFNALKKTDDFKARVKNYKEFISATKPS